MPSTTTPRLRLIESLRFCPLDGYFLLERHLARLCASAAALGFRVDRSHVVARLEACAIELAELSKVRLELAADGQLRVAATSIAGESGEAGLTAVVLAPRPVLASDPMLRHKTTERAVYDRVLDRAPAGVRDGLLWNERAELTETTIGNLVVRLDDHLLTPPVASGLLPGTYRAQLLSQGEISEAVVRVSDLQRASALYRINSVRLWTRLRLQP